MVESGKSRILPVATLAVAVAVCVVAYLAGRRLPPEEHLDHSGFIPALFDTGKPRILGTPPSKALIELLLEDSIKLMEELPYKLSSFKKSLRHFQPINFDETFYRGDTTFTLRYAGHITGAAMIDVEYKNHRILYTGDFSWRETELHSKPDYPPDRDSIDILIIESTYANRDHPPRKDLEKAFYEDVRSTYESGGHVLIPAFAVDRQHEIISVLRKYDRKNRLPIYMDGMSKKATKIMMRYPEYIKDFKTFKRRIESAIPVTSSRMRARVLDEPCVIVSTAGMLSGGPALYYILHLNPKSKVIFVGYCVEGTNGWYLQNKGVFFMEDGTEARVDLPVEYYDFSAHAGRSELFEFVRGVNPEKVFVMHGDEDNAVDFADELALEGFDAVAPKINDTFEI